MPCRRCGKMLTESNHNVWSNLCAECELGLQFIESLASVYRHLFVIIRRFGRKK